MRSGGSGLISVLWIPCEDAFTLHTWSSLCCTIIKKKCTLRKAWLGRWGWEAEIPFMRRLDLRFKRAKSTILQTCIGFCIALKNSCWDSDHADEHGRNSSARFTLPSLIKRSSMWTVTVKYYPRSEVIGQDIEWNSLREIIHLNSGMRGHEEADCE